MLKKNEGQKYIDAFPQFKKWINECSCCHRMGYAPNMPEKITIGQNSLKVINIKRYFEPLQLNQENLCEICEKILK